ncbi:MAG TPA: NUDIX hydrolase [Holophagaceae bacterium]|nr:NUDIX hydrolase [Holophagaceae bacterium]
MPWSLTVAALIERQGRFLFVEEQEGDGPRVLNQPAGHVEEGEPLLDAVVREVAEETGLPFTPEALVGIYQLRAPNGKDYVRVCFAGTVPPDLEPAPRDADILACHWLTPEELTGRALRSGLVARCLQDLKAGRRLPLAAAGTFLDAAPR